MQDRDDDFDEDNLGRTRQEESPVGKEVGSCGDYSIALDEVELIRQGSSLC